MTESLDKYQRAAVETTETRVMVSAAPGSGKTRTLAARFNYLVNELHIAPANIVLLTFTRFSASEIRDRIGDAARGAFIGTFHSFALRILQNQGQRRGWEPEWLTLLDEEEVALEEESILKDLGLLRERDGKRTWKGCRQKDWQKFRTDMTSGSYEPSDSPLQRKFMLAWETLLDRLNAENVLTFGFLILEALEVLRDPEAAAWLKARYQHFLIDETQDSDAAQYRLTELFEPKSLFMVGDPRQAIYSWRGGRVDLFIKYAETLKTYDLPYSYRFNVEIGQAANALIAHNDAQVGAAIEAVAKHSSSLEVIDNAQWDDVGELIREELKDRDPTDIAVLGRRHATLDELAVILKAKQIPHIRIGGRNSVPGTAGFRVLKAYLRLMSNPRDRRAFMGIAAFEDLDSSQLRSLREQSARDNVSLLQAAGIDPPRDIASLFAKLKGRDEERFGPAIEYAQAVCLALGISQSVELSQTLSMETQQDQIHHVRDQVPLMTVFASKGLGFPVVFVVGLNSKEFPSSRSVREGHIEEERRAFFVAITRGQERVYVVQNASQDFTDGPSRFLAEIGNMKRRIPERPEDDDNLVM